MWERTVEGHPLDFHLAGINNENFIMSDDQSGSWWQQVSGEAILGPLKGQKLRPVFHDELTFATWRREHPHGRVLRPDPRFARAYGSDSEKYAANVPVVTPQSLLSTGTSGVVAPRTIVAGVVEGGVARAYPRPVLLAQNPLLDSVGGTPIMIALDADQKSPRAFERLVDGGEIEFFAKPGSNPLTFLDSKTGSEWDFSGKAVRGPLAGHQLRKIAVLTDYWFDWKTYHPTTGIYTLGALLVK